MTSDYFDAIERNLETALAVANAARESGADPEPMVEIPVATDMADRVENLLAIEGLADRIRELEETMGREEVALALARDFAEGTVGTYESRAGKIEGAVRTAVALLTEGVVAAPIEGIDRVDLGSNDDGSEFVRVYYAGPIRSAGGTAQALSVLVADYTRALLGVSAYEPRSDEIERYVEEVGLYDTETGLQYSPSDEETRFIAKHCPIMLDGEPTGEGEVSGFRDLERVDTNATRGGMCLVLAEGIALKAPKIQRYTRELEPIDWPWLESLIDGSFMAGPDGSVESAETTADSPEPTAEPVTNGEDGTESAGPPRPAPSSKYLRDLIAGRPVFAHPSRQGGFRLRYGRARNHGFATAGIHPATMHLLDDFLATGTQIKTERPGKAAGVVPVDSIEGPTVRLATGEVRRIDDPTEAIDLRNGVDEILDVGEYLVNFGEFVENNHALAPAGYTVEWWRQEYDRAGADLQALADDPHIDLTDPTPEQAIEWATTTDAPLHPRFTYCWHDISVEEFQELLATVAKAKLEGNTAILPRTPSVRRTLERLLVEHRQEEDRIEIDRPEPLLCSLGFAITDGAITGQSPQVSAEAMDWPNAMRAVNETAPFVIRERAPTRIGIRMGRPEKSERRELSPAVHTLFPIGDAGGDQRNVMDATRHTADRHGTTGEVEVQLGRLECPACGAETFQARCPGCETRTERRYECIDCGNGIDPDPETGRVQCSRCERRGSSVTEWTIPLNELVDEALETVGEREAAFDILKGVKGLTSADKTPEPLEKGILRAKHDVSVFKDGTIRYDMTDLPVTAVTPEELGVDAGTFRDLGYDHDVDGDPLEHDDQLVGLKVQDIVLSDGAADHLLRTADFVDDLLEQYYGMEPFYEVDDRTDLVGELVFGMAPHTSAAVVGRIVGFTTAAVGYAHPYFHAAKRRNCFHPATEIRYRSASDRDGWHTTPIEAFVDDRLMNPRTDDFGTITATVGEPVTVPSLRSDGTVGTGTVTAVSKHPAPDHLVSITTTAGRSVTMTPDHPLLVDRGERFERIPAAGVESGDRLPIAPDIDTVSGRAPLDAVADGGHPDPAKERVISTEYVESSVDYTYSLTVAGSHSFEANGILTANCDGDEDCVMLLMDGLLNFSGAYLPDKRGGSVSADARLIATDGSRPRFLTFEDFWDKLDSPVEYDGKFRKKTCLSAGWSTIAFDADGRISYKPIEKAIRYRAAPGTELLRVRTANGRTLDITEHHSVFTYDDGIREVAGAELEPGDRLVAPGTIHGQAISNGVRADGGMTRSTTDRGISVAPLPDAGGVAWTAGVRIAGEQEDATSQREPNADRRESTDHPLDDDSIADTIELLASDRDACLEFLRGVAAATISADDRPVTADITLPAPTRDHLDLLQFACHRLGLVAGTTTDQDTGQQSITICGPIVRDIVDPTGDSSVGTGPYRRIPAGFLDLLEATTPARLDEFPASIDAGDHVPESVLRSAFSAIDPATFPPALETDFARISLEIEGDISLLSIESIDRVPYDGYLYDLQVGGEPVFTANWVFAHNSMDAPLVMTSRIDPAEIDDEAHNIDIVDEYPLEFYEATRELADPETVDIQTAESTVGTDAEYDSFPFTHDTSNIALGPAQSAYKTLGPMMDKMDAQLELARTIRAVDETDVAERVIEYHFLPDLIGNLRAFTSQETRCHGCGAKFRRMPLSGMCTMCGGTVSLTVHEGSVTKYLDAAIRVADEYGCREYTKQRLAILERRIESIFENDKNKQSGIADFM